MSRETRGNRRCIMPLNDGELFNVAVWTAELTLLVYIAYQSRLSNRLMAQGARDPE